MNAILRKGVLGVIFTLGFQSVFASQASNDIRVVTGLALGYSEFSFDEKLDHDISFPSATVPLAVTYDNWLVSLNTSTTLSDADISEEEDTGKASRDDLDFTLGYRINNQWSVFAGYKYGKTKMRFTPRDQDDEEDGADVQLMYSDESYKQQGPFVGASYSWQFENAGRLSVSVAYAFLDATNEFAANTDDEEDNDITEFDDLTGRVEGDTTGFSYSVNWAMPLSSNVLFQTRLKVNSYQQDLVVEGARFDNIDETFTSLHVGLAYVF